MKTDVDIIAEQCTAIDIMEGRVPLPPVRSEPLLAACDIIRRLVDKVNVDNEYDEHNCPNGQPCGICKLVAEAKAFIAANAEAHASATKEPIA